MLVETFGCPRARHAAMPLAALAIGLALLSSPGLAQTTLVTTRGANPVPTENPMAITETPRETARPFASDSIRPFRVSFPESDIVELQRRIQATRWPERETVDDTSQGVQLETTRKLADYW